MIDDPVYHLGVAAAVVELSIRHLQANDAKTRRLARAWWLMPNNPEREFWCNAAGVDPAAVVERLEQRNLLEPETDGTAT